MISRVSLHPRYQKIHPHGSCKSPRSKAPNRSSRARAKTDAMTTRISMCTAFNAEVDMNVSKSPDVYSVDTSTYSDREVNRQLKKLYGRAWQKVKAGHPHYAL